MSLNPFLKYCLYAVLALLISFPVVADSHANLAKQMRSRYMNAIIFLETVVKNFGQAGQQKAYETVKFQYSRGLMHFFEDDFARSYHTFLKAQKSLEKILEEFSLEYIDRTELILQEVLQTLVDVNIRYHRESGVVDRMLTDIEPPDEKPLYNQKEFHFVYDKKAMTANVDQAYYWLRHARKLRKSAINLVDHLPKGKPIPSRYRNKRIKDYKKVIEICRKAKRNAIRVHQYINQNKGYSAEPSYRENLSFVEKKHDPVFDTRIPERYVVDLNDALGRIHSEEIDYKVLQKHLKKAETE